jgi:hypothetical protein
VKSSPALLKKKPDIRAITRLVPPSGNLVQGQSELAIKPALAPAASEVISAGQNHYSPAEGVELALNRHGEITGGCEWNLN